MMVARRSFDTATLTRLRETPAADALTLVAIRIRADPTSPAAQDRSQQTLARTHHTRRVRDPDHRTEVV